MKALVDKWEPKKLVEEYPNFLDCPLNVFMRCSSY